MKESTHRDYFSNRNKSALADRLDTLTEKTALFFGHTSEEHPYSDHGCIVEPKNDGLFAYTVEGHGIGSNAKPDASLVFRDCQRLMGSIGVTSQHSTLALTDAVGWCSGGAWLDDCA